MKKLSLLLMTAVMAGGLSAQKITTNGTGTAGDIYHLGGNIGIGTDDPKALVHAKDSVDSWRKFLIENKSNSGSGVAAFHAKTATGGFYMLATPENYYDPIHADRAVIYGVGQAGFNFVSSQGGSDIRFFTSGFDSTNQAMMIDGDGAVLIGSKSPGSPEDDFKLAVDGKGVFQELVCWDVANWSDYVFDDNYELQSLNKVEAFIEENNHLPDVPSADEVSKNGISMAKMDATLLRKIEELTLYIIDMEKRLNAVETKQ